MAEETRDADHEHKLVTIVVNGTAHEVEKGRISYADVVALAFPTPSTDPNIIYSVTYRHGHGSAKGILSEGDSVEVVDGLIFNVTPTTKS